MKFTLRLPERIGGITADSFWINWDDGSAEQQIPPAPTVTHEYVDTGTYRITVAAMLGGVRMPDVVAPTVLVAAPYVLIADRSPSSGPVPFTVTVTLEEPDTQADSFRIDWGDSTPIATLTGPMHAHTYMSVGTYSITVTPVVFGIPRESVTLAPVTALLPPYTYGASVEPQHGELPALTVTCTITQRNGVASEFRIDWGDGTTSTTTTTTTPNEHTYTRDGTFEVSVTATFRGESLPPVSAGVVVVVIPPYEVTAEVSPSSGQAPLLVTLTITEQWDAADVFEVDWGDGSGLDIVQTTTPTHTYVSAGTFNVTVTPVFAGLRDATVEAGTVEVTPAYTYSASVTPTEGDPPLPVTLTITEANGSAGSFDINWGDGTVETGLTGLTHEHAYTTTGAFTIIVTAHYNGVAQVPYTLAPVVVTTPYALEASVSPTSGTTSAIAPLVVTLTLTEPKRPAQSFTVNWGNGTVQTGLTGLVHQFSYTTGGTFTVTVTPYLDGVAQTPVVAGTVVVTFLPFFITASVAPLSGNLPFTVTITITNHNGIGWNFRVQWGDGTYDTIYSTTATHTYTGTATGNRQVIVQALYGGTYGPEVLAGTVTLLAPYSYSASVAPLTGPVPHEVTLTISQQNGTAESFTIDWGNGDREAVLAPGTYTHTYGTPGTFGVTVTATRNGLALAPVLAGEVVVRSRWARFGVARFGRDRFSNAGFTGEARGLPVEHRPR
ncbi:PKD domain-containing protein [Paraburkholderia adhaesiva]|uniref:PKD domain-containing protein n=1 Tax=Paraburkholderia adhaesiva TaxID=2883244 RepID=UPI001F281AA7|nr:hypothetical protein [Paraburkholderia adhaesiva]